MTTFAKFAVPNALVLVEDSRGGEIPDSMAGALIVSTRSCIAVGCMSDADGQTEFILGVTREVDPHSHPAFQGKLKTPSLKIAVRSVLGETIIEKLVSQQETMVQIWVNDTREPDRVIIGVQ